jgi:RNA polymerase sigma-70 factor (ECF subfamily)
VKQIMRSVCNKVREDKKSQATAKTVTDNQSEIVRLVERAAGGNFEAFGKLYNIYLDRIYRYVFYQAKDKMLAEDITEDVFFKAWKAIDSCKGKGHTFSAWIYRIAHNHIINTLRSMQKCTSIEIENTADISDPKLEVETTLDRQELKEMIAELPQNQRQVVILKFIEDMDNREIGQIMSKSEGAVRLLQMRALTALRQKLSRV